MAKQALPQVKRARAKAMLELKIKGVPEEQIATQFNMVPRTVRTITAWGRQQGLIEEISAELTANTLPKIAKAFNEVLDESPEKVDQLSRGYTVKLKAASELGKGLGVFKQHKAATATVKGTMDLDGYLQLRKLKEEELIDRHLPQGEVIEGEVK